MTKSNNTTTNILIEWKVILVVIKRIFSELETYQIGTALYLKSDRKNFRPI